MSTKGRDHKEERAAALARNALLVAGSEMGPVGDHWPVINATIHAIAKDLEDLKIERNVDDVLKDTLYEQLAIMESELPHCTPEARAILTPKLKELREVYDAHFTPADDDLYMADIEGDDVPDHIRRTHAILSTLEADDE